MTGAIFAEFAHSAPQNVVGAMQGIVAITHRKKKIFTSPFPLLFSPWKANVSFGKRNRYWSISCFLRGHNWVQFAHRPIVYWYLEFKLRYHKNLKLFSIRVKELSEPIALWKKKKRRMEALFISIFLSNRSLSNARWFYGKKPKIWKRNLYLTENWNSRNEWWCAADNHNYMCRTCAKGFLDLST